MIVRRYEKNGQMCAHVQPCHVFGELAASAPGITRVFLICPALLLCSDQGQLVYGDHRGTIVCDSNNIQRGVIRQYTPNLDVGTGPISPLVLVETNAANPPNEPDWWRLENVHQPPVITIVQTPTPACELTVPPVRIVSPYSPGFAHTCSLPSCYVGPSPYNTTPEHAGITVAVRHENGMLEPAMIADVSQHADIAAYPLQLILRDAVDLLSQL